MRKIILFVFPLVFFTACINKPPGETEATIDIKAQMIQADKDFSKMSEDKGMRAAFLEYIDSEGVLLRPDEMPIKGGEAIDYISRQNDTAFSMTWEPRGALVAQSGELGYTYGTYLMKFKHKDSVIRGTYVSIWKKQPDGSWKYVLDSGNDGLGEY